MGNAVSKKPLVVNKGVLFPNDKGSNTHWPDFKGNLAIRVNQEDITVNKDGTIEFAIYLSAWLNEDQRGQQRLGLSTGTVIPDREIVDRYEG